MIINILIKVENVIKKMSKSMDYVLPKRRRNNGGWLQFLANPAFWKGAASVASVAGSVIGAKDKDGGEQGSPQQLKDYPEAEKARGIWGQKLEEWGADPNYGAISPNWADIWQQAQDKVRNYYHGTATSPTGAVGKLKSSLAGRNMSDSPALERSLARMAVDEGGQMKDLATTQATTEAQFGEKGRLDWLQSLQSLSGQNPNFAPATTTPYTSNGVGEALSGIGNAGASYFQQKDDQAWMEKMLQLLGGKTTSPYTTNNGKGF